MHSVVTESYSDLNVKHIATLVALKSVEAWGYRPPPFRTSPRLVNPISAPSVEFACVDFIPWIHVVQVHFHSFGPVGSRVGSLDPISLRARSEKVASFAMVWWTSCVTTVSSFGFYFSCFTLVAEHFSVPWSPTLEDAWDNVFYQWWPLEWRLQCKRQLHTAVLRTAKYKEWRKRISLYHYKRKLAKRPGESVLNIIGSLTGSAWRLLEDFDIADAEKETAFPDVLKILDKHFQYDDRVQLPSDFDAYFGLSRKQGQTLLNYVTDHDDQLKKLERHGIQLPAAVQGWHLLRKSNLTKEQRQMITLKAPTLEKNAIVEALYLILGQDHKASVNPDRHFPRKGKGRGYAVFEDDDEAIYSRKSPTTTPMTGLGRMDTLRLMRPTASLMVGLTPMTLARRPSTFRTMTTAPRLTAPRCPGWKSLTKSMPPTWMPANASQTWSWLGDSTPSLLLVMVLQQVCLLEFRVRLPAPATREARERWRRVQKERVVVLPRLPSVKPNLLWRLMILVDVLKLLWLVWDVVWPLSSKLPCEDFW